MTAVTTNTTPSPQVQASQTTATSKSNATTRDIRLDFYRGLAMFIILIAHVPGNRFTMWIPARFGFSDATEIFVFCSGMASALAFGNVFVKRGWGLGLARVAYRVWQVYWAHIGLFIAITATMVALNQTGMFERDYVRQLNLHRFFDDPETNLLGLVTLTYVPNYFDILPMYLGILAMIPLMMALAKVDPRLAMAASVTIWFGAQTGTLALPAEPWSAREWFFNPFGWQLVFFTGFAFMRGWIPAPPVRWSLILIALAILLISLPLHSGRIHSNIDWIKEWRADNRVLFAKTDFGVLRYLHFLALAYLAWFVAGPGGSRLRPIGESFAAKIWRPVLTWILKVGQQSLAVFIMSMWLARVLGMVLDQIGRTTASFWAVNLTGFGILILTAYGAAWVKSHPWRKPESK